ncbi:hypothetical protein [Blastococcus saxobsidens]|uniref:hypothetical protein n=1 Tax=Blastococcus saxobsidens TaxID=138336 RepID=UPI0002EE90E2|nr:hypothetical protein [Blastococcus saxobsidens]
MSAPGQDRADGGAPPAPTVSTAPAAAGTTSPDVAPGHRWWSAIPRNLGRARTSTVVLGLLFVGVFALYLNVRPPDPGRAPAAPGDTVEQPVTTTEPTEPTEDEPTEIEPTEIEPTETGPTETGPTGTGPTAPTTPPPTRTGSPSPTAPPTTGPSPDGEPTEPTTPETTAPAPTGGTGGGSVPDSPTG